MLVRQVLEDLGLTYGDPVDLSELDVFEQNHGYLAQAEFSIVTSGLEAPVAVESWLGQLKLGCGLIRRHRTQLAAAPAAFGFVVPFLGDVQKANSLVPEAASLVRLSLDDASPERLLTALSEVAVALRDHYDDQPGAPVPGLDGVVVARQSVVWLLRGMLLQLIRNDVAAEPSDNLAPSWSAVAAQFVDQVGLPYLER